MTRFHLGSSPVGAFSSSLFLFLNDKNGNIRQTGTFLHAPGLHFFNSIELWGKGVGVGGRRLSKKQMSKCAFAHPPGI